jgi:hypothetical protein
MTSPLPHLPRLLGVLAAAAAATALLSPPASAGVGGGGAPGPRQFEPTGLPYTFDAGLICDFPVTAVDVVNQEYSRTFPNGNTLVTGRLVLRFTNDTTGTSIVRNASGPVLSTTGANGASIRVYKGASISPIFAGNDATGTLGQGLFAFRGPTVFTDNVLTSASGPVEDLCAALAG